MRQPSQKFVAAVVMHDGLRDDSAERRHARHQPWRDAARSACPLRAKSRTSLLRRWVGAMTSDDGL
jgi:hypothetical protein